MKKIVGYSLSGLGLATLALSSPNIYTKIGFLAKLPEKSLVSVGVVLIIAGVVMLLMDKKTSSKVKHAKPEVPIYEGTGKNRKIVGYQKA